MLHEEFGIETGFMTTIHSYTGDQPTLDTMHKDLYRARAAAMSQIPTTTGAAKALGLVLPELAGKLDGSSVRVPTPNVSCIDLAVVLKKSASVEAINAAMKAASEGALAGVLGYTEEKLVSTDFNHDPHSSTFAADQTKVMPGNFIRVLSWYDNEWGFSNRMGDIALEMAKLDLSQACHRPPAGRAPAPPRRCRSLVVDALLTTICHASDAMLQCRNGSCYRQHPGPSMRQRKAERTTFQMLERTRKMTIFSDLRTAVPNAPPITAPCANCAPCRSTWRSTSTSTPATPRASPAARSTATDHSRAARGLHAVRQPDDNEFGSAAVPALSFGPPSPIRARP